MSALEMTQLEIVSPKDSWFQQACTVKGIVLAGLYLRSSETRDKDDRRLVFSHVDKQSIE